MKWKMLIAIIAMLCLVPGVFGGEAGTILKPSSKELVSGVTRIEWSEYDDANTYNITLSDELGNYLLTIKPNETGLYTYYDFKNEDGEYIIKVESDGAGVNNYTDTKDIKVRDPTKLIHIYVLAGIVIAALFMVYIYAVNDKIIIFGIFAGMLFILLSSIMFSSPTYHTVCNTDTVEEISHCANYSIEIPSIFKTMFEVLFLIVGLGIIMDAMFSHGEKFKDTQNNI